jgi:signal transduction histidine kinase
MFSVLKSNLARRILLLVSVSILLMLVAFILSGWLAITQTSEQVRHQRQVLSKAISQHLDSVLAENLRKLENYQFASGVNLEDDNWEPEKDALHDIYINSIFSLGVFIADQSGVITWLEPSGLDYIGLDIKNSSPVQQTLISGRTTVSGFLPNDPLGNNALVIVTPIHNQEGRMVGLVGGRISLTGNDLYNITHMVEIDDSSYIGIVDNQGNLLASSQKESTAGVSTVYQTEETVQWPLAYAPWTLVVRQPQASADAPIREMQSRILIFGIISILIVMGLTWGMARSILEPLSQLKVASQTISRGDLSKPIPNTSNDEIGQLATSFESMRIALRKSLEEVQGLNQNLETKVQQRTRLLEQSYREIAQKEASRGELLRKLFSAQEEERRRIARELHDETSQSLNSLVMRLDSALSTPDESPRKIKDILKDTKSLAIHTVDNVHKIIFDLRPAILDDLGLISAMRWYSQNRLKEKGIDGRVEVDGEEKKLPAPVENAIFRVVQEAITNVIRHAEAQNVLISVEYNEKSFTLDIEDDGKGFIVKQFNPRSQEVQGLGLMGMRERVSLIGGELKIDSEPGKGTHVSISVPL